MGVRRKKGMRMQNKLQIFENQEFGSIRAVTIDGEPWFVGKDVAEALGYEKARNAVSSHVDEEDKKGALIQGGPGGAQTMTIINESGMYALIFGSKLESAKQFKHWVTSEVLPAIRKTGAYGRDPRQKNITMGDCIQAAKVMASVPDSQRYVVNILKHCFPDIDAGAAPVQPDGIAAGTQEEENPMANATECGGDYAFPFNHNMLDNYLVEHNISRNSLKHMLGCSDRMVTKWCNGSSRPTRNYRVKICEALNLPVGYFDNTRRCRRIRK